MANDPIPDIVISRLPRYLQTLIRIKSDGVYTISSHDLGKLMGISPAQIRKDLSHFGEFGKQGTGYDVAFLIQILQDILAVNHVWEIALIGAGDLGHAIARYQGFTNRGFRVAMVFDNDPSKIGTRIGEYVVQDMIHLAHLLPERKIIIAMLTVPVQVAQKVADELVAAGIRAILNYAPIALTVPAHVWVENIDPIIQLQHMTYYLKNNFKSALG